MDPKPTENEPKAGETVPHSDSDEDGNEILEESPCGRWQKRREKVWTYVLCVHNLCPVICGYALDTFEWVVSYDPKNGTVNDELEEVV